MIEILDAGTNIIDHRYKVNNNGFRTKEFSEYDDTKECMLAFGCSHTFGYGNELTNIWPEVLAKKLNTQLFNLGSGGKSVDYIHRMLPVALEYFSPTTIFIMWPNYLRFEYFDSKIKQSMPTDSNRIQFMESNDDKWCMKNYIYKTNLIIDLAKEQRTNVVALTIDQLDSIIDHADRWPKGFDNSHFDKHWHSLVAEIFNYKHMAKQYE